MIKVFLIDDHAVMRTGLKTMLSLLSPGEFAVAGEASGNEDSAAAAIKSGADVILLDVRMPGKGGLDILSEILMYKRDARVLMLTTSDADNDVYIALERGAKGYILKDSDAEDVLKAIRAIAEGRRFIPPNIRELYNRRQMMGGLSAREIEILKFVRQGLKSEKIGERLGISIDGVKKHIRNIFAKLEVPDRAAAISEAIRRGFLPE